MQWLPLRTLLIDAMCLKATRKLRLNDFVSAWVQDISEVRRPALHPLHGAAHVLPELVCVGLAVDVVQRRVFEDGKNKQAVARLAKPILATVCYPRKSEVAGLDQILNNLVKVAQHFRAPNW